MKKVLSLVLITAITASLMACGKTPEATAPETSAAAVTTAEPEKITNPETTSGDKYGGIYRFAMFYVTNTFFTPKGRGSMKYFVTPSIEPLVREQADGTITPFLAESLTTDKDSLSMQIKLHEGIKFHDGSDLNAEVLKWNLDYAIENGKASLLSNPETVTIIDDYTVEIQYQDWSVSWQNDMLNVLVYSKQAYDEHGEQWCDVNMIGTGPYVMQSYKVDDKIIWTRNDNYWQAGLPYLDGMELIWIYDTTASASAFMNKEIDNFDTSSSDAIGMMVNAGYQTTAGKLTANCTFGFALPCSTFEGSKLTDLNVRKAIQYGVDWNGVAAAATGGYGEWKNQLGYEDAYNYDDSITWEYDVDKAKQYLSDAGCPDGFETVLWSITNNASNLAAATALQSELKKLGIEAELKVVDTSVITAMRVNDSFEGILVHSAPLNKDLTSTLVDSFSPDGNTQTHMIAFTDPYVEALTKAVKADTMDNRITALKEACWILTNEEALLYPAFYIPKYQFTQEYLHDNGCNAVSAFQWTPELAYKDAAAR